MSEALPSAALKHLSDSQLKALSETVKLCWINMSGTSSTEAKQSYLRQVKVFPLFGAATFWVESNLFSKDKKGKAKKVILAIDNEGIKIINTSAEVRVDVSW